MVHMLAPRLCCLFVLSAHPDGNTPSEHLAAPRPLLCKVSFPECPYHRPWISHQTWLQRSSSHTLPAEPTLTPSARTRSSTSCWKFS